MRKAAFILSFLLFSTHLCSYAQLSGGMTGMLNIPSAENTEAGTVYLGGNFLPKEMLPEYFSNEYNTGNYFLTANVFSFLQISYRMTLKKDWKDRFRQQDRSFGIRIQPLKESERTPGVVIGTFDPLTGPGVSAYESYYVATSKGFKLKGCRLFGTLGYYFPFQGKRHGEKKNNYDGVFAGVSLSPSFYKDMSLMAEYDCQKFNIGASIKFLNCIRAHVFTQEFKNISAGLRYECELWH